MKTDRHGALLGFRVGQVSPWSQIVPLSRDISASFIVSVTKGPYDLTSLVIVYITNNTQLLLDLISVSLQQIKMCPDETVSLALYLCKAYMFLIVYLQTEVCYYLKTS